MAYYIEDEDITLRRLSALKEIFVIKHPKFTVNNWTVEI